MNQLSAKRVGYELDCWPTTGIDAVLLLQTCRAARWESSKNLKPIFENFEARSTEWLSHFIWGRALQARAFSQSARQSSFRDRLCAHAVVGHHPHIIQALKSTAVAQSFTASEILLLVPATAESRGA